MSNHQSNNHSDKVSKFGQCSSFTPLLLLFTIPGEIMHIVIELPGGKTNYGKCTNSSYILLYVYVSIYMYYT